MAKSKNQNHENAQIDAFLKNCFARYLLSYDQFFFEVDEFGDAETIPLVTKGVISEKILNRAAEILGLSPKDILSCNKEAAWKWYRKFPFFELLNEFHICYHRSYQGEVPAEEILLKAIFGGDLDIPERYNSENIRNRMMEMLKDVDGYLPGTCHEGADVVQFAYETNHFFSFPKIGELIGSFMDLVSRARELFFKAWEVALDESEIKEYNFLVTTLRLVDNIAPHSIYYENLQKLIPVYRSEGFKGKKEEFFDIVHLKFCEHFAPWNCKEFSENPDLAQLYASCYSNAKSAMFKFGRSVRYFSCRFKWSDETLPNLDMDEIEDECVKNFNLETVDEEIERDHEEIEAYERTGIGSLGGWTMVRVPKTAEEIGEDGIYAEKLIRLGGVPSKGGIRQTFRRKYFQGQEFLDRASARSGIWGWNDYE